jgi:hypothetical protein
MLWQQGREGLILLIHRAVVFLLKEEEEGNGCLRGRSVLLGGRRIDDICCNPFKVVCLACVIIDEPVCASSDSLLLRCH